MRHAEAALSRLGGELAELRQRHADALSTVQRQARLLERELVAEEEGERGCSSGVAKGKAGRVAYVLPHVRPFIATL